jgi:hypothetical protein
MRVINNIVVAAGSFFEEHCARCGNIAPNIDANTYYGHAIWRWQGIVKSSLAGWKSASGALADELDAPGFAGSASGDFTLTAQSSCVDSGNTLTFVSEDFTGLSRPQGLAYDRGAFERDQSSSDLRASRRPR